MPPRCGAAGGATLDWGKRCVRGEHDGDVSRTGAGVHNRKKGDGTHKPHQCGLHFGQVQQSVFIHAEA